MAPIPRILIVEDDEIIANLISVMLEKRGYNIVGKTGTGEESIFLAAELEPDLILMDISLAGVMDGVTASCYIFQLFQFPIVFLTAHCDDTLLARAKNAQPLGYIIKPFTDRDLASNVELALYNHSMRKKYLDMYPVGEPKKIMAALDILVITDIKGKIIFCNPYGLRFLGLQKEEVLMHYWREVMMIINDQTNEEIPDPVPEVVQQMLVVTHEFNTAVVPRSGRGRKASVIIRPIKDDNKELIGIFFHIREKTLDQIKMAKKT
ncbi:MULTISPECIES: response regulator [unclassified Methanoregula]|uniref:response regulator n=1 Tax=unclassified Methanoregula TaxID=2649730 RepID=UPI0009C5DD46|nr:MULTISPECIES: response regulator [unclassified Methanoregula]OPX64496.1 MAG: two-component response regulator [Methanoregula sp. PtaB.Bin085]OPY35895.1 MAG: two-component response regulator [Methanoregula sp. PtaU1.Bin006]